MRPGRVLLPLLFFILTGVRLDKLKNDEEFREKLRITYFDERPRKVKLDGREYEAYRILSQGDNICDGFCKWIVTRNGEVVTDEEIIKKVNESMNYASALIELESRASQLEREAEGLKDYLNKTFVGELILNSIKDTVSYLWGSIKGGIAKLFGKETERAERIAGQGDLSEVITSSILSHVAKHIYKALSKEETNLEDVDSLEAFKEAMYSIVRESAEELDSIAKDLERMQELDADRIVKLASQASFYQAQAMTAKIMLAEYYALDRNFDSMINFLMEYVVYPAVGGEKESLENLLGWIDSNLNLALDYCPKELLKSLTSSEGACDYARNTVRGLEDFAGWVNELYERYPYYLKKYQETFEKELRAYSIGLECSERNAEEIAEELKKFRQEKPRKVRRPVKRPRRNERIDKLSKLIDEYLKELEESGISEETMAEKGYHRSESQLEDLTAGLPKVRPRLRQEYRKSSQALPEKQGYASSRTLSVNLWAPAVIEFSESNLMKGAGGRPWKLKYRASQDGKIEIWTRMKKPNLPTPDDPVLSLYFSRYISSLTQWRKIYEGEVRAGKTYYLELGRLPKGAGLNTYYGICQGSAVSVEVLYKARLITSNGTAEDVEKVRFLCR